LQSFLKSNEVSEERNAQPNAWDNGGSKKHWCLGAAQLRRVQAKLSCLEILLAFVRILAQEVTEINTLGGVLNLVLKDQQTFQVNCQTSHLKMTTGVLI